MFILQDAVEILERLSRDSVDYIRQIAFISLAARRLLKGSGVPFPCCTGLLAWGLKFFVQMATGLQKGVQKMEFVDEISVQFCLLWQWTQLDLGVLVLFQFATWLLPQLPHPPHPWGLGSRGRGIVFFPPTNSPAGDGDDPSAQGDRESGSSAQNSGGAHQGLSSWGRDKNFGGPGPPRARGSRLNTW